LLAVVGVVADQLALGELVERLAEGLEGQQEVAARPVEADQPVFRYFTTAGRDRKRARGEPTPAVAAPLQ
jgi:hypothetical protein